MFAEAFFQLNSLAILYRLSLSQPTSVSALKAAVAEKKVAIACFPVIVGALVVGSRTGAWDIAVLRSQQLFPAITATADCLIAGILT